MNKNVHRYTRKRRIQTKVLCMIGPSNRRIFEHYGRSCLLVVYFFMECSDILLVPRSLLMCALFASRCVALLCLPAHTAHLATTAACIVAWPCRRVCVDPADAERADGETARLAVRLCGGGGGGLRVDGRCAQLAGCGRCRAPRLLWAGSGDEAARVRPPQRSQGRGGASAAGARAWQTTRPATRARARRLAGRRAPRPRALVARGRRRSRRRPCGCRDVGRVRSCGQAPAALDRCSQGRLRWAPQLARVGAHGSLRPARLGGVLRCRLCVGVGVLDLGEPPGLRDVGGPDRDSHEISKHVW